MARASQGIDCKLPSARRHRFSVSVPRHFLAWVVGLALATLARAEWNTPQPVEVSGGPATSTLPALIEQTGLEVVYQSSVLAGVETRPVQGSWSPVNALRFMVERTPLKVVPDPESGAVALVRRESIRPGNHPREITAKPRGATAPTPSGLSGEPDQVFTISPFMLEVSRDQGYYADSSLAGGRTSIPLRNISAAISIQTRDFLEDIAASNFIEAVDWTTNANSDYTANGPQIFNDYAASFRSLGSSYQSRNYFAWFVNSDFYNTARIDFARGPNSIVFGDAGVGGIANTSTLQAMDYNFGEITLRWQSYGGFRSHLDINRAINDQLSVRVALLHDRTEGWMDQQRDDRDGAFVTATYALSPRTAVRGEFEWGNLDRVVGFAPRDSYSRWVPATGDIPVGLPPDERDDGVIVNPNDTLVYNPALPDRGIQNWRGLGQSVGTFTQMLTPEFTPADSPVPTIERLSLSYQSAEAVVEQPYGTGSVFLEHQFNDRLFLEVAGTYSKQSRHVPQHFGESVFLDVNPQLPDGSANPNYAKFYTEDRIRHSELINRIHEYRASAAYLLRSEHFDQRLLASFGQRWNRFDLSEFATVRTNGANPDLSAEANRVHVRRYIDDQEDSLFVPAQSGDLTTKSARLRGSYEDNNLTYLQFAAAGSWLADERINTMFAIRRDFLRVDRARSDLDPITREWIGYLPEQADPDAAITTYTAGIVDHLGDGPFSLYANYAESFQPSTAARNIDGSAIPAMESEGWDFGVRFNTPDNRFTASVGYYISKELNRLTRGAGRAINDIWSLMDSAESVPATYADSFSQEGEGWEFEITANPTPNWRLLFNFALPETRQFNGLPDTQAYYDRNIDVWLDAARNASDPDTADAIYLNINRVEDRIESLTENRRIDGTFDYTANLFTKFSFPQEPLRGLSLGFGIQARGNRLIGNSPDDAFDYIYADDYQMLAGLLEYRFTLWDRPTKLQLNVFNLLDDTIVRPTRYGDILTDDGLTYAPTYYFIQNPRRLVVTVNHKF